MFVKSNERDLNLYTLVKLTMSTQTRPDHSKRNFILWLSATVGLSALGIGINSLISSKEEKKEFQYEDFTNGYVRGKNANRRRPAEYSEIGLGGEMFTGGGELFGRNAWMYETLSLQPTTEYGTFPQIDVVTNPGRTDYRVVMDVPMATAMKLHTRDVLSIDSPAKLSFKAGGGYDPVRLQAYLGNMPIGEEITPTLDNSQQLYETNIDRRINGRLGFVARDSGFHTLGVYCHLDDITIQEI